MIALGLRAASLENGNISIIQQRLYGISLSDCANKETRDWTVILKSPLLAGIFRIDGVTISG
jgi:hypothetical protein